MIAGSRTSAPDVNSAVYSDRPRAPEIGHKRENNQRGHCVRQRLSVQLSEAGMDMETEKLQQ